MHSGMFILRVGTGLIMMLSHGWGKLAGYSSMAGSFSDPLGLGSEISLILTIFAEFFCSLFLVLGLFTRYAVIPLIINMAVAVFIVHAGDPFSKQEHGLLFLLPFVFFLLAGPGKYSMDTMVLKKRKW